MTELPKTLTLWHVRGTVLREWGGTTNRRPLNCASTVIATSASAALALHLRHYGPEAVVYSVSRGQQDEAILLQDQGDAT